MEVECIVPSFENCENHGVVDGVNAFNITQL